MCLIIFAHQAAPGLPLVVAANRDEFFPRPTQHADFWSVSPAGDTLLAGKDLQAGGTWLGICRSGRFAAVTNIRDPSQAERKPKSRGELTVNFLAGQQTPAQYCETLRKSFDAYAGYNLLVADRNEIYYINNLDGVTTRLQSGVFGLSNGLLNSDWPKVTQGRERLTSLLARPEAPDSDSLIQLMSDRRQASDTSLPETGLPLELERQLSAAFIHNTDRNYGTRCSTAVIVEDNGRIRFNEQNFNPDGLPTSKHFFEFDRTS